jgi:cytidylate kinase
MQSKIITIDGGSASGKGTIARMLAREFNFNYLNSGALYRIVAYECKQQGIFEQIKIEKKDVLERTGLVEAMAATPTRGPEQENFFSENIINKIVQIGQNLAPIFLDEKVILDGIDIWPIIRTEEMGKLASEISIIPELRQALTTFQRNCADIENAPHGLVAEGRDMGTKIFPDSKIKIFLNASAETQAKRRLKDELAHDPSATYENILEKIKARDKRDKERAHGALTIAEGAFVIDTDNLNIEQVFDLAKNYCKRILEKN